MSKLSRVVLWILGILLAFNIVIFTIVKIGLK